MKKPTNLLMLALSSLFVTLSLNSCDDVNSFFEDTGSSGEEVSLDPEKTTVYIGNYYGGLGNEWLNVLTKKYCETHPDVQFKIDDDKNKYLLDNISNNLKSSRCALFFIEKIYYYDMVSQGLLADITDVVTSPMTEFGDDATIESKLDSQFKNYLAYNDVCDGKYYALPTYISHHGLVYDVDLFENKKLFIGKNSTADNIVFVSGKTENSKSLGIDKVANTYDDGLPETFEQFKKLMNEMIKKGVTPFIWSGQTTRAYFNGMMDNLTADFEGKDNYQLNYTFNGSTKLYGDSVATTITEDNAYELQRQEGRMHALEFARHITNDSVHYASSSSLLTSTHLEAQDEFISSSPFQGVDNIKPIGMLIEGDWWENEAKINGDFNSVVDIKGEEYAYGKRRFGVMPLPKFDGSSQRTTFFSGSAQNAFFVNNTGSITQEQRDIAKDFLKFCHTEMGLQTFTQYTGMMRPYSYEITDEQYESLTYFSKTLYQAYKSPNTDIVHDLNISQKRIKNSSYFLNYWNWATTVGSNVFDNPAHDFINNKNLTASAYFQGLITYHKNRWDTL